MMEQLTPVQDGPSAGPKPQFGGGTDPVKAGPLGIGSLAVIETMLPLKEPLTGDRLIT